MSILIDLRMDRGSLTMKKNNSSNALNRPTPRNMLNTPPNDAENKNLHLYNAINLSSSIYIEKKKKTNASYNLNGLSITGNTA